MIKVNSLTKAYGPRMAIEDLNFEISSGEVVGFLGPNGAGKSTTMKILTGFMPASSGSVTIAGHEVHEDPIGVKSNIGYLPENPPVYLEMQVTDYLTHAVRLHGVDKTKIGAAVDSAISRTGLGDVRKRLIGNLSKGFRQRVGLAQAIAHNPKVLILDEPTVGLDPKQIIEIRSLIKSLAGEHTVILSSHILPEVTATCSRIIIINQGKIVAQDSLEGLSARISQGLVYKLAVSRPSASAESALKATHGVKSVQSQKDGYLLQLASTEPAIREAVVETAFKAGVGITEFSADRMSLEDVFLKLTTTETFDH